MREKTTGDGEGIAVSVLIPAFKAQETVGATVAAALRLPGAGEVIVADDGSGDETAARAEQAGASRVLRLGRNRGKGAALRAALAEARGEVTALLDADLGASASQAGALLSPVLEGGADMTLAVFPPADGKTGFGLALGLARWGLWLLTGRRFAAPLSGQRAIPTALLRELGVADGFGVEVGLTAEALYRGARVAEIPLAMEHSRTGRDLPGFLHRGRQFRDALKVISGLLYGVAWPRLARRRAWVRGLLWFGAMAALVALGWSPPGRASGGLLLLSLALWPVGIAICNLLGLRGENYLARRVPKGYGLHLLLVAALGAAALWRQGVGANLLALIAGFALLGLIDDIFGRPQVQGFRGHLAALARGRLTTGALKTLGGGALALWVGYRIAGGEPLGAVVNGLVIALAANLVNLLDVRPGRAIKGFLVMTAIACATRPENLAALLPLLAGLVVAAPADLAARAMMGDTGSNLLGAAAGAALVMGLPLWGRAIAAALLLALNLLAERWPLGEVIARVPALRWADELGRETAGKGLGR
jgi:UDP-N-acetylmuramyl pentapeptide phosphotransferase/UDP-N-acetylglucosamine-1-phosphate transferase